MTSVTSSISLNLPTDSSTPSTFSLVKAKAAFSRNF